MSPPLISLTKSPTLREIADWLWIVGSRMYRASAYPGGGAPDWARRSAKASASNGLWQAAIMIRQLARAQERFNEPF